MRRVVERMSLLRGFVDLDIRRMMRGVMKRKSLLVRSLPIEPLGHDPLNCSRRIGRVIAVRIDISEAVMPTCRRGMIGAMVVKIARGEAGSVGHVDGIEGLEEGAAGAGAVRGASVRPSAFGDVHVERICNGCHGCLCVDEG